MKGVTVINHPLVQHNLTRLRDRRTEPMEFRRLLSEMASLMDEVPHVFEFARDPQDAHYVDLAVAANAKLIVSRDKDLLSLRDATTTDGREFLNRFPMILIRATEKTRVGVSALRSNCVPIVWICW